MCKATWQSVSKCSSAGIMNRVLVGQSMHMARLDKLEKFKMKQCHSLSPEMSDHFYVPK